MHRSQQIGLPPQAAKLLGPTGPPGWSAQLPQDLASASGALAVSAPRAGPHAPKAAGRLLGMLLGLLMRLLLALLLGLLLGLVLCS